MKKETAPDFYSDLRKAIFAVNKAKKHNPEMFIVFKSVAQKKRFLKQVTALRAKEK